MSIRAEKKGNLGIWIFFILSPFLTVLYSIKHYKRSFAKNIIWAFTIFYGYTFVIFNDEMDSMRYKEWFLKNVTDNLTFSQFLGTLYSVDNFSTGISIDIVEPLLSYLVAQFTSDFRFLFAAYGLIVGFFYSRNIWYVLERIDFSSKKMLFPLLLCFAVIAPIWDLNGFRFCSATHIFLYGSLPFLFERDMKKLIFCLLSCLVHFSFVFPVIILIVYMILGNRFFIYYMIFIASMFVTSVNIEAVNEIVANNFPEVFQVRTSGYTNVERAKELKEDAASSNLNWYVKGHENVLKWLIIIFISVIFFRGKDFVRSHQNLLRLICFTLFLYGMSNVASLLPSGGRFIALSNLFAIVFIIFYVEIGPKETVLNKLIPLAVPMLWLFIIVRFRMSLDTFGVSTVLGNPIVIMFFQGDTALINLIK
ncbi:MAG: EpsG family protein [Ignavibacteria bacterium]|nr:EpsG family protein [Ignavibacteria bacterium]